MQKRYISLIPILCMTVSLFGATIRVYNKLGNNDKIVVTAITPQKKMVEPIESMHSFMFNTWFNGITGFEWEIKGSKWAAPLEMRALQTEGRLYIQRDGKYLFKPCLPCRESTGQATLIKSATAPESSTNVSPNIPTPPPLPTTNNKVNKPNNNHLNDIKNGKQLRPTQPNVKPVDQKALLLKDIKEKKLTPAQARELNAKPDTGTARSKMLDDIKNGAPLKKTVNPTRHKPKHEMIDPLSKAIDARREQLKQIEKSTTDDDRDWED